MPNGILLIDKPQGFTSFDVVAKMRGIAKTRKIGHAGTLDPMATGVLPLFIGNATKACDILPSGDKSYLADFVLGMTTDTLDSTGTITSRCEQPFSVTEDELQAILPEFTGDILQIPPMYSAVSVGGKRLYELAHKGIEIERKPRPAKVYQLQLTAYDPENKTGTLSIHCGKGTYVRTICDDIGQKLGCGCVMTALRRTMAAGFPLEQCITLEEAEAAAQNGRLWEHLLPVEQIFSCYPEIRLSEAQSRMYQNGVKLDLNRVPHSNTEVHRVYHADGHFFGLARCNFETNELLHYKNFAQETAQKGSESIENLS